MYPTQLVKPYFSSIREEISFLSNSSGQNTVLSFSFNNTLTICANIVANPPLERWKYIASLKVVASLPLLPRNFSKTNRCKDAEHLALALFVMNTGSLSSLSNTSQNISLQTLKWVLNCASV